MENGHPDPLEAYRKRRVDAARAKRMASGTSSNPIDPNNVDEIRVEAGRVKRPAGGTPSIPIDPNDDLHDVDEIMHPDCYCGNIKNVTFKVGG